MFINKLDLKTQKAFTLIELVIVVAIVGILATIALPSYLDSVSKSRRNDAKGALLGFANAMERFYTETNSYCDAANAGGAVVGGCGSGTRDSGPPNIYSVKSPVDGASTFYDLTIQNTITATTYILVATPANAQANDKCGTLTLTNTGVRDSSLLTPAECW